MCSRESVPVYCKGTELPMSWRFTIEIWVLWLFAIVESRDCEARFVLRSACVGTNVSDRCQLLGRQAHAHGVVFRAFQLSTMQRCSKVAEQALCDPPNVRHAVNFQDGLILLSVKPDAFLPSIKGNLAKFQQCRRPATPSLIMMPVVTGATGYRWVHTIALVSGSNSGVIRLSVL